MATGDLAAAKGLLVVASTKDLRLGYDDINKRGDELAIEMDARILETTQRTIAVTNEINARIAADALKFDANKVIISATAPAYLAGAIWLKPV